MIELIFFMIFLLIGFGAGFGGWLPKVTKIRLERDAYRETLHAEREYNEVELLSRAEAIVGLQDALLTKHKAAEALGAITGKVIKDNIALEEKLATLAKGFGDYRKDALILKRERDELRALYLEVAADRDMHVRVSILLTKERDDLRANLAVFKEAARRGLL